jgi:hypothetical protein
MTQCLMSWTAILNGRLIINWVCNCLWKDNCCILQLNFWTSIGANEDLCSPSDTDRHTMSNCNAFALGLCLLCHPNSLIQFNSYITVLWQFNVNRYKETYFDIHVTDPFCPIFFNFGFLNIFSWKPPVKFHVYPHSGNCPDTADGPTDRQTAVTNIMVANVHESLCQLLAVPTALDMEADELPRCRSLNCAWMNQ